MIQKKLLLLVFLSLWGLLNGQTHIDKEKIVQQCIDFKEFKSFYAEGQDLYLPDDFGNIQPVYNGKEVVFLSKEKMKELHPAGFFSFWIFDVNEKNARVLFSYNYNQNTPNPKDIKATLLMEKRGDEWVITNSKLSW